MFTNSNVYRNKSMIYLYRLVQKILLPLILVYLIIRLCKGKEELGRIKERLGDYSIEPDRTKKLIWIHAASVGESNSVLPLIEKLSINKKVQILLTTGTVTSAKIMRNKLPKGVIHQYVPIDLWFVVKRFIKHWQPAISLFVDSDLWPNMLHYSKNLVLINARMSNNSYENYKKYPKFADWLLAKFEIIFAQSEQDCRRYSSLTKTVVVNAGNLKYDGPAPAFDKKEYLKISKILKDKKVVVVSSSHAGEEEIFSKMYKSIAQQVNDLVMILVPRHPHRGDEVAEVLQQSKLVYVQRSKNEEISQSSQVYLADTIGEVGLWYALADVVLIGKSLFDKGGQSPLEALKAGKPVITGKSMSNFKDIMDIMQKKKVIFKGKTQKAIIEKVQEILQTDDYLENYSPMAKEAICELTGATETIFDYLNKRIEK
jgi:3-deoxy-D-manno-octulosonic-acid transferase